VAIQVTILQPSPLKSQDNRELADKLIAIRVVASEG